MAQATLAHVLQEIMTLDPDELRQVQQAVQARLAPGGYSPEEQKVLEGLLQAGLLKEIKPKRTTSSEEHPLIQVQGKPVSETIIEERR